MEDTCSCIAMVAYSRMLSLHRSKLDRSALHRINANLENLAKNNLQIPAEPTAVNAKQATKLGLCTNCAPIPSNATSGHVTTKNKNTTSPSVLTVLGGN